MGKALIIMSFTFLWNLVGLWFSGRILFAEVCRRFPAVGSLFFADFQFGQCHVHSSILLPFFFLFVYSNLSHFLFFYILNPCVSLLLLKCH